MPLVYVNVPNPNETDENKMTTPIWQVTSILRAHKLLQRVRKLEAPAAIVEQYRDSLERSVAELGAQIGANPSTGIHEADEVAWALTAELRSPRAQGLMQ